MSFVRNLSAARVSRRCTPRSTERSFRRRSPVKVWNVGKIFAFVFVGFPTRRQRTPMKPHTLSPFFFVGFPTAANKRAAGCFQSNDPVFFKEPVCAAKIPLAAEVWPARKRPLEREDVLRQTLYQGCVATWKKRELRNKLLRNSH